MGDSNDRIELNHGYKTVFHKNGWMAPHFAANANSIGIFFILPIMKTKN